MTEEVFLPKQHIMSTSHPSPMDETLDGISPIKKPNEKNEETNENDPELPTPYFKPHSPTSPTASYKKNYDLDTSEYSDANLLETQQLVRDAKANKHAFSNKDKKGPQYPEDFFMTPDERSLSDNQFLADENETDQTSLEGDKLDPLEQDDISAVPFSPVKSPRKKRVKYVNPPEGKEIEQHPPTTFTYLLFKINRIDDSYGDESLMNLVRSLFKAILKSCNRVSIQAPPQSNLPAIVDNYQLPKKSATNSIRRYIHFGRMTNNFFSGKILIEHAEDLSGSFFTTSQNMRKFLESSKVNQGISIQVDRFGSDRVIKAGFLFGALSKESRVFLANQIEGVIFKKIHRETPIIVSRENLYASDDNVDSGKDLSSAWTTIVKCKETDLEQVTAILTVAFGRPSTDSNYFRPLLRFFPSDLIFSTNKTREKFIHEKTLLDKQIIAIQMRNLKPLDSVIQRPPFFPIEEPFTVLHLLSGMADKTTSKRIFHTVTPHGMMEDSILLASTRNFSTCVQRCRRNLTAVAKETFPWIQDSDLFNKPRSPAGIMIGIDSDNNLENIEIHLDSMFNLFKEDFPPLSDDEDERESLETGNTNDGDWAHGPPKIDTPREEIDVTSNSGANTSTTSKASPRPKKSSKFKKARVLRGTQDQETLGQLSDSDASNDTRRSRLRAVKIAQQKSVSNNVSTATHAETSPTPPRKKKSSKSIVSKALQSISQAFSPGQLVEKTSPSLKPDEVDAIIASQQQEIIFLRDNIQSLNEQVNLLQLSIHEQNQQQDNLALSIGNIQSTLHDHHSFQTSMRESVTSLEGNNVSLSTSMSIVMQMLQKMDLTLTTLSNQDHSHHSTPRSGEASQDRPSKC